MVSFELEWIGLKAENVFSRVIVLIYDWGTAEWWKIRSKNCICLCHYLQKSSKLFQTLKDSVTSSHMKLSTFFSRNLNFYCDSFISICHSLTDKILIRRQSLQTASSTLAQVILNKILRQVLNLNVCPKYYCFELESAINGYVGWDCLR